MNATARKRQTAHPASPYTVLRDADWLTATRARDYARMLMGMMLIAVVVWVGWAAVHQGLDPLGKPLGADFPSFWAASRLALDQMPTSAYDEPIHWAVQRAAFSGAPVGYSAFFYPPPYLLACLPLALLPYLPALGAWTLATGASLMAAIRTLTPDRGAALGLAAYPAVFSNLAHGQNAFLTTGLFAASLLGAQARPVLSGLLLGLLVIKPHLALVVPVALLAAGRWRMITAAALSSIAACLAAWLVFGDETWLAFLQASPIARQALEQNLVGDAKMQSLFAAVRLMGGPVPLAWTLQIALSLGVIGALAHLVRKTRNVTAQAAMTACAALLASPFLLDYDLMLAALPLLWLLREGRRTGFRPWEKTVMLAAFVLPLVSRLLAGNLHLPTAPLVLAALFAVVVRRAAAEAAPQLR